MAVSDGGEGAPFRGHFLAATAVAMAARLALVALVPQNFSFDAYERWAGRDHLLVHGWLPATQAVIAAVHAVGGGLLSVRVVMAAVGALAAGAGAVVAARLGGRVAGWFFLTVTFFPPFLTWTTVLYQEGTFLALLLGAVALALAAGARPGLWFVADLVAGAVALVRYEGWAFVALYLAWRRRPAAAVALWGVILWLAWRYGLGAEPHSPSPVDFADWQGMDERFGWSTYGRSLLRLALQAFDTGAGVLALLAALGAVLAVRERRAGALLLALVVISQVAAVLGWMVGIETSTYRMQTGVGVLLGLFAVVPVARLWERSARPWVRVALVLTAGFVAGRMADLGLSLAERSVRSVRWEVELSCLVRACPECRWQVIPRKGLGTRNRHDGCEVVQGLTELRHPDDLWCLPWPGTPARRPTHRATWQAGGYVVNEL